MAIDEAKNVGAELLLGDRDVKVSSRRPLGGQRSGIVREAPLRLVRHRGPADGGSWPGLHPPSTWLHTLPSPAVLTWGPSQVTLRRLSEALSESDLGKVVANESPSSSPALRLLAARNITISDDPAQLGIAVEVSQSLSLSLSHLSVGTLSGSLGQGIFLSASEAAPSQHLSRTNTLIA